MEHTSLNSKIEAMLTHQQLFFRNTFTDVGVNMIVHVRTQMSHHPRTYDVKAYQCWMQLRSCGSKAHVRGTHWDTGYIFFQLSISNEKKMSECILCKS